MRQSAFTMIELIMVMVIISALSVVAYSKLGNVADFDSRRAAEDLVEAIRYAQQQAMVNSAQGDYHVVVSTGGFTVSQGGSAINNPYTGVAPYTQNASHWSGVSSTAANISFNSRGLMCNTAPPTDCTTAAATQTLTVQKSGASAVTVTVEAFTGFAYVN